MKISNVMGGLDVDDARVGFHAAFLATMETIGPDPLEQLFTQVDSNAAIEQWDWLGDLPGFTEWKGDRKLGQIDRFRMRLENRDWSSGIRVHQNELADDNTGMLRVKVEGLANKARRHRTELAVKALLNGFAGNVYPEAGNGLAYDGAFFFSTTHNVAGYTAVQSNRMTAVLDPDGTALEAATLMLGGMSSYDGKETLDLAGTTLIVGPALQFVAERLMAAETLANGATNIHRNRFKVLVSRRLVGAFANFWFLADLSAPVKPLIFQMRKEIQTSAIVGEPGGNNDSMPRFTRGELWFGAEARYNVGYFEPRVIVGSTGAG